MSGLYANGFDFMPAGAAASDGLLEADGWYLRAGAWLNAANEIVTGRFGFGKALSWNVFTNTERLNLVRPVGVTRQVGFAGWAVYVSRLSGPMSFSLYDAVTDAPQVTYQLGLNGVVRAYGGPGGALLGVSKAGAYLFDRWFMFEYGAAIDSVDGWVEARVNTEPVLQVPTCNTQATANASFDAEWLYAEPSGASPLVVTVDDHYLNDDQGAANNTFLGNVRVKSQFVAGPGDLAQFAIGGSAPAATNWQSVLNTALDDSQFVYDPSVGHEDNYALEAILGAEAVHFLQLRAGMRQTDATQRKATTRLKVGGVEVGGADHALNQTYAFVRDIYETNPATGLGLIGTDLNAARAGHKITV